jgi:Outer membrane protein beta-barrel domain
MEVPMQRLSAPLARLTGIVVATLLSAAPLTAQQLRPHLFGSAGFEALYARDGSTFTPGYVGQLGVTWTAPARRVGWRVSAFGFQRQRDFAPLGSYTGSYRSAARLQILGLEGTATYALSRGRVRPYVLGGAGVYQSRLNEQFTEPSAGSATTARATQFNVGATAGLGLEVPIGRAHLFLESRYLLLSGSHEHHFGPLVLGLRL